MYYFSLQGFTFSTSGGCVTLYGSLVSVSGDNLGSHAIGGFKGSCTALRPCRHCMVTYNEIKDKVDKSVTNWCLNYYNLNYFIIIDISRPMWLKNTTTAQWKLCFDRELWGSILQFNYLWHYRAMCFQQFTVLSHL